MPRFIFGDQLGNLKYLQENQAKIIIKSTHGSVQSLGLLPQDDSSLLAATYSDGSASILRLGQDNSCSSVYEWKNQFTVGERFIASTIVSRGVYTCTSDGTLGLTQIINPDTTPALKVRLPTRLHGWCLSSTGTNFTYGGYEVDASVWDVEKAFAVDPPASAGQKRQSKGSLFPAEIWRAKNIPNDSLSLRQPIRVTSLIYLNASSSGSQNHLLSGTQYGDVRRYDTRAGRKPSADWKGVAKTGGVERIENGCLEHEVFVADNGGGLFALDLRNGKIAYGYKGIAGAISSMASTPGVLASASLDRFVRLHSTCPLPSEPGGRQLEKGEVLEKVFVHSIPTTIVWDKTLDPNTVESEETAQDDDIWDQMEGAASDSDEDSVKHKRKKPKTITKQ